MTTKHLLKKTAVLMIFLISITAKAQKSTPQSKSSANSEVRQATNAPSEVLANEVYSEAEMKILGEEKTRVVNERLAKKARIAQPNSGKKDTVEEPIMLPKREVRLPAAQNTKH